MGETANQEMAGSGPSKAKVDLGDRVAFLEREKANLRAELAHAREVLAARPGFLTLVSRQFMHALSENWPDVAGVAGIALLSFGAGMIYRPAALIVGGALILGCALLAARER